MAIKKDEQFNSQVPPKDIMCATCKYRLKPITVAGTTYDRSGYAMCDKYENKPQEIVWGRTPCALYKES